MEPNQSGDCAILHVTTEEAAAGAAAQPDPSDDCEFAEADAPTELGRHPRAAGPAYHPTRSSSADCLELEPVLQTKPPTATAGPLSVAKVANPRWDASGRGSSGGGGGGLRGRIKFCVRESPGMSRAGQVRFLRRFRLGDTYKLKTRTWLVPQFLSGALTLTGVVLTLVGIISLQINKYLHACDEEDGIDCKSNKADINNVMMPIGVGTTGGGLCLILISGFVFMHAFCFIYEDAESEDDGTHEGVLHIPASQRAALLGSATALSPDAVVRCQSYYDNLQDYCPAD